MHVSSQVLNGFYALTPHQNKAENNARLDISEPSSKGAQEDGQTRLREHEYIRPVNATIEGQKRRESGFQRLTQQTIETVNDNQRHFTAIQTFIEIKEFQEPNALIDVYA